MRQHARGLILAGQAASPHAATVAATVAGTVAAGVAVGWAAAGNPAAIMIPAVLIAIANGYSKAYSP